MSNRKTLTLIAAIGAGLVVQFGLPSDAPAGKPKTSTISGTVIDLTCAAKGRAMQGSWVNVGQDHNMGGGKIMKDCATMCLKGGQPAALWKKDAIVATFACNPRATLSKFAADEVEVSGFWAGKGGKGAFIPQKIRKKGDKAWTKVNCATMHK